VSTEVAEAVAVGVLMPELIELREDRIAPKLLFSEARAEDCEFKSVSWLFSCCNGKDAIATARERTC